MNAKTDVYNETDLNSKQTATICRIYIVRFTGCCILIP